MAALPGVRAGGNKEGVISQQGVHQTTNYIVLSQCRVLGAGEVPGARNVQSKTLTTKKYLFMATPNSLSHSLLEYLCTG